MRHNFQTNKQILGRIQFFVSATQGLQALYEADFSISKFPSIKGMKVGKKINKSLKETKNLFFCDIHSVVLQREKLKVPSSVLCKKMVQRDSLSELE